MGKGCLHTGFTGGWHLIVHQRGFAFRNELWHRRLCQYVRVQV